MRNAAEVYPKAPTMSIAEARSTSIGFGAKQGGCYKFKQKTIFPAASSTPSSLVATLGVRYTYLIDFVRSRCSTQNHGIVTCHPSLPTHLLP